MKFWHVVIQQSRVSRRPLLVRLRNLAIFHLWFPQRTSCLPILWLYDCALLPCHLPYLPRSCIWNWLWTVEKACRVCCTWIQLFGTFIPDLIIGVCQVRLGEEQRYEILTRGHSTISAANEQVDLRWPRGMGRWTASHSSRCKHARDKTRTSSPPLPPQVSPNVVHHFSSPYTRK